MPKIETEKCKATTCNFEHVDLCPMMACVKKLYRFAHSASNLKCRISHSLPFKYFDCLSRFNDFNRDPVFDYNLPNHSQIVYGSIASSNNPRPEPVPKNLLTRRGQRLSQRNPLFAPPPKCAHENPFHYRHRIPRFDYKPRRPT